MYNIELGVFMYKYSINDLPNAFDSYFIKRSNIHSYPTRHNNDLHLTKNKRIFSDHGIRTCGPILETYTLKQALMKHWNIIQDDRKLSNISLNHLSLLLKEPKTSKTHLSEQNSQQMKIYKF